MKEDTAGAAYGLFLTSDSKVQVQITAGGTVRTVTSVTAVASATWTHIAGTYDGTHLRVWADTAAVVWSYDYDAFEFVSVSSASG